MPQSVQDKIKTYQKAFQDAGLGDNDIHKLKKDNAPVGALKDKWTKETVKCPACGHDSLDKFTGGANIEEENTLHTAFIYHCRICDINLIQEEYEKI